MEKAREEKVQNLTNAPNSVKIRIDLRKKARLLTHKFDSSVAMAGREKCFD
jgi:hypothetical protein